MAAWLCCNGAPVVLQLRPRCVAIGAPLHHNRAPVMTQRGPYCKALEMRWLRDCLETLLPWPCGGAVAHAQYSNDEPPRNSRSSEVGGIWSSGMGLM